MNKESIYKELVAYYGSDEINITKLGKDFPDYHELVLKTCERTPTRGVWSIANLSDNVVKFEAPVSTQQTVSAVYAENKIEVPKHDKNYVPWGCYDIVRKVVSTDVWAPVYITGDSGNGKTLGVEQACHSAKRKLISINITNETAEEDLIGNMSLRDGNMIWNDGPVIRAMKEGAVILLDEIDQATSKILCLQTILQNYSYTIKKTGEIVHAAPGFMLVATANTKGNGEGSDRFIGANVLNEAFLERFSIIFEQSYPDEKIEQQILNKHLDPSQHSKFTKNLIMWANSARNTFLDGGITSPITTRRLVQICNNYKIFGSEETAIEYAISRFSKDDKEQLLEFYNALVKPKEETKTPEPEAKQYKAGWVKL